MRHQRSGKKLGRDSAHRKALYANLAGALIEHGRIKTTITKAKAVRPIAEQMITLGRRGDLHARRQAVAFLRSKDVVHKLFDEVGPRVRRAAGRLHADHPDRAAARRRRRDGLPRARRHAARLQGAQASRRELGAAEPAAEAEEPGTEAAEPVAEAGEPEPAAEVGGDEEPEAAAPEAATRAARQRPWQRPSRQSRPGTQSRAPAGDEPEAAADPAADAVVATAQAVGAERGADEPRSRRRRATPRRARS